MKDLSGLLSPPAEWRRELALLDAATGQRISYGDLPKLLLDEASRFPSHGTIATCCRPDFKHALVLLAALALGRTVCPVSYRLPPHEVGRLAASSGATALFRFGKWESLHGMPGEELPGCRTLLFTSGSSGAPKGVIHRVESHIAAANGSASRLPLGAGCAWALDLPLHHVSGLAVLFRCLGSGACVLFPDPDRGIFAPGPERLITHLSVVSTQLRRLLDGNAPLHNLRAILAGGGPFPNALLSRALDAGAPVHLTYGMTETASQIATRKLFATNDSHDFSVGFPLPSCEIRINEDLAACRTYPAGGVADGFRRWQGANEAAVASALLPESSNAASDEIQRNPKGWSDLGRLAMSRTRLQPAAGMLPRPLLATHPNSLQRHLRGKSDRLPEIHVRGEVLFERYLGREPALQPGGWFATGDLGSWSAENGLHLLGRRDRMFVSGGENIFPERIEAALLACTGVRAAAVASIHDEEYGARPVAFVSGRVRAGFLREALAQKLAKFEIPVKFFKWPTSFPENESKVSGRFFERFLAETDPGAYGLITLE